MVYVRVNDNITQYFDNSRRVRQGDSLSPTVFGLLIFFAEYCYSFYTFTGVIKQSIHVYLQVIVSFSNFTHYTYNNRDI